MKDFKDVYLVQNRLFQKNIICGCKMNIYKYEYIYYINIFITATVLKIYISAVKRLIASKI